MLTPFSHSRITCEFSSIFTFFLYFKAKKIIFQVNIALAVFVFRSKDLFKNL